MEWVKENETFSHFVSKNNQNYFDICPMTINDFEFIILLIFDITKSNTKVFKGRYLIKDIETAKRFCEKSSENKIKITTIDKDENYVYMMFIDDENKEPEALVEVIQYIG